MNKAEQKEYNRQYYAEHREEIKERSREYYAAHKKEDFMFVRLVDQLNNNGER